MQAPLVITFEAVAGQSSQPVHYDDDGADFTVSDTPYLTDAGSLQSPMPCTLTPKSGQSSLALRTPPEEPDE